MVIFSPLWLQGPAAHLEPPRVDPAAINFASFQLDLRGGRLLRNNEPIPLRPKTWSVLQYLAQRPGVLVSKNDLLDAVWGDVAVTESVLSKSIGELRVALGDNSRAPRLIETVSRRGFRFIAATHVASPGSLVSDFKERPATRDQEPEARYFVGRQTELQQLATLIAKARAGGRQVVFITGPAGIGKTALVEAFLAQLCGVLYARWYLHAIRAERNEAIAMAAQLDDLARRLRTPEHRLLVDSVLGRTALYDGRFAEVNGHMRRLRNARPPAAAATAGYGPNPLIVAISHSAIALWFLGHAERAQMTARAAVLHARESGHFLTLSAVLMQAALLELLSRNPVAGGELAEEAVSLAVEHGFAFWNAVASLLRGWGLVQQGRAAEGNAVIERARAAMQATGTRFFTAFAYAFLADGCLRAGALSDGLAAADAGLTVAQTTLDRAYEPELWRLKGELIQEQLKVESSKLKARSSNRGGNQSDTAAQAEACFQRALRLARASQAKSLELRAATSLARAWQARGRTTDARQLLGGVCKSFGARAGGADLVEARTLLAEMEGPPPEVRRWKHIRSRKFV
jgi:DNA-binding winged helix-turn-helix (wHTH) protein/predicted ATPase